MKTAKKLIWKDLFQKAIEEQFDDYCYEYEEEDSAETMLSFLLNQHLVDTQQLKRYVILQEFNKLLPSYDFHKTHTVLALSVRLKISERTIWSALSHYSKEKIKEKV